MEHASKDSKIIQFKSIKYNAETEKADNYLGERIAEARTDKKLSLAAFKSILSEYGVEIGTAGINKWELGRAVPNAYQLFAIALALGLEEDMSFFIRSKADLNGEGRCKLQEYKQLLIDSGKYKPAQPRKKIRYITKPVSYLKASAGTGAFLDEGQFEEVRFPENAVPDGSDFALYVSGDSMEPVYHDGQIVWVQKCEALNIGDVGIFVYGGYGYIKSYDEQEPDENILEDFTDSYGNVHMQPVMVSYNENYDPIEVAPHLEFQIVGRVL